jgi:hypothetical protein
MLPLNIGEGILLIRLGARQRRPKASASREPACYGSAMRIFI